MSKETPKIAAQTRTVFGDNASRRLRKAGTIPAIVYGKGVEPKNLGTILGFDSIGSTAAKLLGVEFGNEAIEEVI